MRKKNQARKLIPVWFLYNHIILLPTLAYYPLKLPARLSSYLLKLISCLAIGKLIVVLVTFLCIFFCSLEQHICSIRECLDRNTTAKAIKMIL